MHELMLERGLAYYGILTNCFDKTTGEYMKEVLLYKPSAVADHCFTDFVSHLDNHDGFKLHDKNLINSDDGLVVMWRVGNTKYSRKDFEKIMTQFYSEINKL
jgi:hypothetical protein